jgi:hypothetical protein
VTLPNFGDDGIYPFHHGLEIMCTFHWAGAREEYG